MMMHSPGTYNDTTLLSTPAPNERIFQSSNSQLLLFMIKIKYAVAKGSMTIFNLLDVIQTDSFAFTPALSLDSLFL